MRNLYNLYRLQIILTVAAVMFPQGIPRWIAQALLALLMLLLWIVLKEAMRMEEKDRKAWQLMEKELRETPPLDN